MRLTGTRLTGTRVTSIVAATAAVVATAVVAAPAGAASTAPTRVSFTTSSHPLAHTPVTLTATVSPRANGGSVTFKVGAKALPNCAARPVSAGRASCRTRFTVAGPHTIVAAYSGHAQYRASSARATVRIAAAPGNVVGGVGACTTTKAALVGVDFAHWSGPIVRGCGTAATSGRALLKAAGFSITNVQRFAGFVCRLGNVLFDNNTQYPTVASDRCVNTPPASAYWSFWYAPKGANTWTYSSTSADGHKPANGEVEAWTFGATDIQGSTGKPTFTPNQLRAGLPSSAITRTVAPKATTGSVDVHAAVGYLTGQLTGGDHYETFGTPDLGLTLDAEFALAASGGADSTLAAMADYTSEHSSDYTLLGTSYEQYADGGSIGKVALLAEVTGYDPHDFGGVDLISALADRVCTAASATCAGAGNYQGASSVFKQSLGVLAQLRAGVAPGSPETFLLGLQHGSGAFPSLIPGSDSDVDSTAMAAMALALDHDQAAQSAVAKALAWIAGRQNTDGGFTGTSGNSINTAGLALQALSLGGTAYRSQIDAAQGFLAAQQLKDGGFPVSAGDSDSDVRAATQALGGVIGTPFGTLTDDVAKKSPQVDPAAAADYLVGQLVDGDHLEYAGGYGPNYGGTADLAIALAAQGGHDDTLATLVRYLEAHTVDYADPAGTGQYPGPYSGQVAKLALLAEITGQDPTHFGGFDLLSTLIGHVCTAADSSGGCTAAGDFYQSYATVSQALAVLALQRGGVAVPSAALDRLLQLQCTDGGFSSKLIAAGSSCTSDVDTTGFAVQALAKIPSAGAAVQRAVAYLRGAQQSDGGWIGAAGENSNSTALAIQGLLAAPAALDGGAAPAGVRPNATGSDPAVKKAVAFLATLQNKDGGFGISAATPASDALATNQVLPAIDFGTLTTLEHDVTRAPVTGGGGPTSSPPSSGGSSSGGTTSTAPTPTPSGSSSSPSTGSLANTGTSAQGLLGYALVLLVAGAALLLLGRRRRVAVRNSGRLRW